MRWIKQFLVILFFSFLGELLRYVIPLPIPASIYGLVLLFLALVTKVVQLEQVEVTARYLIEIMPLMFIPAGVQLITSWSVLQPVLLPVLVIMLISTVLVMGVAGKVTQWMIGQKKEKKHE